MTKETRDFGLSRFCILLLIFTSFYLNSSAQDYKYTVYNSEIGLTNNSVNCVFQDKSGILWIGTNNGLSKFDGYVFINYHSNPADKNSLSSDCITSITEDISGNLWIGTIGGGLNKFDRNQQNFKNYLFNKASNNTNNNNDIVCMCSDDFGNIWFGTKTDGLYKYNIHFGDFENFKPGYLENNNSYSDLIKTISYAGNSRILIGTSDGLTIFDFYNNISKKYRNISNDKNSLLNNSVHYIFTDNTGDIWIGFANYGFQKFDIASGLFKTYNITDYGNSISKGNISCITEDRENNLIITGDINYDIFKLSKSTGHSAIINYDNKTSAFQRNKIMNTIYVDNNNILWIGFNSLGLGKYNLNKSKFNLISLKTDLNRFELGNKIKAICLDNKSNLWIASGEGLNVYDSNKMFIRTYDAVSGKNISLKNEMISSLISDDSGSLWIGTDGNGLIRFEPEIERFTVFRHSQTDKNSISSDFIRNLFLDKDNILWIGTTENEISSFDIKSNRFNTFTVCYSDSNILKNENISVIYEDKYGEIWVGTHTAGLICFNKNSDRIKRYKYDAGNMNSISSDRIASICEDNSGNLWIGTENGLEKFDRNEKNFYHYQYKEGLSFESINAILVDGKNNLWLATNSGISGFDTKYNIFREYTLFDGLQGLEFLQSCCSSSKGEFFFCGVNGVNYFYPDYVTDKPNNSNIILTSFKTTGNSINFKDNINNQNEINLNYSDNSFTMELSLLDFTRPSSYCYAYKLEGLDEDWNYTQNTRSAFYSNLEPGKYNLLVKARNYDEMWSKSKSLTIYVSTPFWKSTWFYLIWGVLLLLITYVNFRKIYIFRKQNKSLTKDISVKSLNLEKINRHLQIEILEKKKIEENLIYSEEQYRLIVENAIEAIIIFHNGYIIYTNPQASHILDYDFKDMSIISFLNYIHPEDRDNFQINYLLTSNKDGLKNNYSVRIKRNDLKEIDVEINSIKLIRNDKYEIIFFIKDITSRRIAETEISNSLKREKELNELRTRFTSMTSHELRTPLTSINTSVEILEKYSNRITPEQNKNNLVRIRENLQKMKRLMDDMLLIGKTDSGMYKLKLEPVDINELCGGIIEEFKLINIKGTKYRFKYETDNMISKVLIDKELIKKVIENLFTNAIKYSPKGSIVHFKMNFTNRFIIFRIKDEGIGIPSEEIKNIFEPFYRASNTGEISGTGLGLAIVKRSVDLHNGRINIKSEVGKGARFIITIPLIKIT